MNIIIADTTALITFAKADILFLLDNLFETKHIVSIYELTYDMKSFKDLEILNQG